MRTLRTILANLLLCFASSLAAQDVAPAAEKIYADLNNPEKKIYLTQKMKSAAPELDGKFEEDCWKQVDWGGDFIQQQPEENVAPTQRTAFKLLYDDRNIYIAYRCFDTEPDKIVRRMARRDDFEGDWVEVNIDSYFDHRTAFSFTISAAGVKSDEFISNNGNNWDESWNPIWYAKTAIDEQGWTAEIRIPLSQLRFGNKAEQVWGLQFTRRDFRKEERSIWQFVSRNAGTWVSSFGELHGLVGLKPQKQIEIQPYILAQAESFEKEEGNPFATGSGSKLSGGVDGKIGVTGDMVIDFTINPDFGQVESDPSVVRLDGFRNSFREQRPFFVENRNIFEYQLTGSEAGGEYDNDLLFYSRRIGGTPHREPDVGDNEYLDMPQSTSILGAAKFSGKTKNGFSIGILESVTAKEYAEVDNLGERRDELVEPLTSYFVGRLQQDFDGGNTVVGGIFTAVNRDLEIEELQDIHRSAYSGGLDFVHRWKDQSWFVSAKGLFSAVNGTEEAILNTQTAFEHYYQRPDADHLSVDSSKTSLLGHGGTVKLGKLGGNWKFETGLTWRSPGLELNDIGFLSNADEINHFFWGGYRRNEPISIFRRYRISYNHWSKWDYGGTNLYQAVNVNAHAMFNNFWGLGSGLTYEHLDISNKALFGGPALRRPRGMGNFFYAFTDSRKKVNFNYNMFHAWGFENTVRIRNYGINVRVQPTNAFNFSFGPRINYFSRPLQSVTEIEFGDNTRYIAATVNQKTLSASIRLNYSITPTLTIQYYGSPFITRVRYKDFKYITNSLAMNHEDRFYAYAANEIERVEDGDDEWIYNIDEGGEGEIDYSFGDPDFTFVQFRSNMVARWEYVPGSELFLVWSQGTTRSGDPQDGLFQSLNDNLFASKAHNIFLVKWTYRFLL